jgi:hypothetical protein
MLLFDQSAWRCRSVVVSGVNRMIADVNDGRTVFHDIYTEAQKRGLKNEAGCSLDNARRPHHSLRPNWTN